MILRDMIIDNKLILQHFFLQIITFSGKLDTAIMYHPIKNLKQWDNLYIKIWEHNNFRSNFPYLPVN